MTVNDVMNLDISSIEQMTRAELAGAVKILADAGNKRIARLEKNATFSPALDSVKRSGGKFSTRGKNEQQLISELQRAKYFMELKSSTVKGAKIARQKTEKFFREKVGIDFSQLSKNDSKIMYDVMKLMQQEYKTMGIHKFEWYEVRKIIARQLFDKHRTPDQAMSQVRAWYTRNGQERTGRKQKYSEWLNGTGIYDWGNDDDEDGDELPY